MEPFALFWAHGRLKSKSADTVGRQAGDEEPLPVGGQQADCGDDELFRPGYPRWPMVTSVTGPGRRRREASINFARGAGEMELVQDTSAKVGRRDRASQKT